MSEPANEAVESQTTSEVDAPKAVVHRHEGRAALVQLLVFIGAGLFASLITGVTRTVFVVLAIVIMVMVHEFGHFITAKWSGMKVTEYFLGFGPRVWSFKWGETEYGVRAIPAGGFVKVIGMNNLEHVDPAEEHRAFRSSPVWRRVVMASAGSFMHFVMAFFISVALLACVGKLSDATTTVGAIVALQGTSPARDAGLRANDRFLAIEGAPVSKWEDVSRRLQAAPIGAPVHVTVQREGKPLDLAITTVDRRSVLLPNGQPVEGTDPSVPSSFIGVEAQHVYKTVGLGSAVVQSASLVGHGTVAVFQAFGKTFSPSGIKTYYNNVTGQVPKAEQAKADETRFVSPVGLVNYADDAAKSGWFAVLSLLFSINLFIGIFNMVPLLPFDGGHVAVALYERVRSIRRPTYHADYAKLVPVSYAVLLVLLVITGSSLFLDITKPLPNQFK